LHRLWRDPDVCRYLFDGEIVSRDRVEAAIQESLELFSTQSGGLWVAMLEPSSVSIGFCGYWFFHQPPERQLIYGVDPKYWHRGLATEMGQAMLRYGFEQCGWDAITASADAANGASLRVLEKLGMHCERRVTSDDGDTIYYVLLHQVWRTAGEYGAGTS
jgi:RimJ/RimL family protein N-acetyltransferase